MADSTDCTLAVDNMGQTLDNNKDFALDNNLAAGKLGVLYRVYLVKHLLVKQAGLA